MKDLTQEGHRPRSALLQLLRAMLTLVAIAIISITAGEQHRWMMERNVWRTAKEQHLWVIGSNATFDWRLIGLLPWMLGSVAAGLIFGLACWMPRRLGFHFVTALALGAVPLAGLFSPYLVLHEMWPPALLAVSSTDLALLYGVLFGVAIASGFGEGSRRASSKV